MSSDEPPETQDQGVPSIGQELPQEDVSPVRNLLSNLRNLMSQPFVAGGGQTTINTPTDTTSRPRHRSRRPEFSGAPIPLSSFSSPAVPNSAWCSSNVMLGAGMVILQPSTEKIVVLYHQRYKYWFLPKGRKDVGESLEATALREAYEEVSVLLPYQLAC
jgi:hypothetical protein